MQGELGDAIAGRRGEQGRRGDRGPAGAVIDATGRQIITVKGEQVLNVILCCKRFATQRVGEV